MNNQNSGPANQTFSKNTVVKTLIFNLILLTTTVKSFAQGAPNVSYPTPPAFVNGVTITPLVPVNSAGPVPTQGAVTAFGGLNNPRGVYVLGGTIYVADKGNNVLKKIPSGSATAIGLGGFKQPTGVAINTHNNNIFVADSGNAAIKEIITSPTTTAIRIYPTSGISGLKPSGIAIDPTNTYLYVTDDNTNNVRRIDITANTQSVFISAVGSPGGIAVDTAGNVYIADRVNKEIVVYTSAGVPAPTPTLGSGYLSYPTDVAVDTSGNVFISDAGNHQVVEFVSGTGSPVIYGSGVIAPSRLAVDVQGNVYVTDNADGTVKVIKKGSYSISPMQPSGLQFDNSTGILSGTPNATSASTLYTVKATNGVGSSFPSFHLSVNNPALPVIGHISSPITYYSHITIIPFTPQYTGGPVLQYSISPTQPAGLTFDQNTGTLYGTPSATPSNNYTITATNAHGTATSNSFTMEVDLPSVPSISYTSPSTPFSVGTVIAPLVPTVSNTGGPVPESGGFSISGTPLPPGLQLNINTGVISGTPTASAAAHTYNIIATNDGGISSAAPVTFTVNYVSPVLYYSTPVTYTSGTAIKPLVPVNTGGTAVGGYTLNLVSGSLPSGLVFDQTTGILSGKPFVTSLRAFSFSVTVAGTVVTSSPVTVTVILPAPPNISYPPIQTYARNTPIIPVKPVNYGGAVKGAYSIFPSLPAGLVIDTQTGIISGTPTTASPPTDYTIRVSNDGTSATNGVSALTNITVNSNISYPPPFIQNVSTAGVILNQPFPVTAPFLSPSGVAVDGQTPENLYVVDQNGSTIKKLPAGGGTPVVIGYGFNNIIGIAVDGAGDVFVANGDNSVREIPFVPASFPTPAYYRPVITLATGLTSLNGIAVDNSGSNFYITQGGTLHQITKINIASGVIPSPFPLTGFTNPVAIALDNAGNFFYVADTNSIIKYDTTTGTLQSTTTLTAAATSICADNSGNIYVVQPSVPAIIKVTPTTGTSSTQVTLSQSIDVPTGITIDSNFNLFISNNNSAFYGIFEIKKYIWTITSMSPALPMGLIIDGATGVLNGTPTIAALASDYNATATDGGGNKTYTIIKNLTVNPSFILVNNTGIPGFVVMISGIGTFSFNTGRAPAYIVVPPSTYSGITVSGGDGNSHTFALGSTTMTSTTPVSFSPATVGPVTTLSIN